MTRQSTRNPGDGAIDPALVQKKRARHRLVGAIFLCLLAAILVPMVLESEPKPGKRDLPLEVKSPARPPATAVAAAGAGSTVSGSIGSAPAEIGSTQAAGAPAAVPGGAAPPAASAVAPVTAPPSRAEALAADAAHARAPTVPVPTKPATTSAAASTPAASSPASQPPPTAAVARADPAKPGARSAGAAGGPNLSAGNPAAGHPAAGAAGPGGLRQPAAPDVLARLIERADPAGTRSGGSASIGSVAGPATGGAGNVATSAGASANAGANPSVGAVSGAAAGRAGDPADRAARRFLVQIGAYSNVQSARTVSDRVLQAGLRPYQETVKTAQGDWIRVRVGPFSSRQDAERAQQDLKRAGVTAAIIAL
ncbi:MAG: SPOR domain-containing protein [Lautropia sp.]